MLPSRYHCSNSFLSALLSLELRAYFDINRADDPTTRSITIMCSFGTYSSLGEPRNKMLSLSPVLNHSIVAFTTDSEIVWLCCLLRDVGFQFFTHTPLYCDNQSSIKIANGPVFHEYTKHIEVNCYFVRQFYLPHTIVLPYMLSRLRTSSPGIILYNDTSSYCPKSWCLI